MSMQGPCRTPQESPVSSRTSVSGTSVSGTTPQSSSLSSVPWWHPEAAQILGSSNLRAIRLLCRLWTYDPVFLRSCFESNWTVTLDIFLWTLSGGARSRSEIDELDRDLKVKEMLQRLLPYSPELSFPSDWQSHLTELLEGEPSSVALKLDRASLSLFEKIQFRDYIIKAHSSEYIHSLEDFFNWHSDVSHHIFSRLLQHPDEVEKYDRIVEVSAAAMRAFLSLTIQRQGLQDESPIHRAVTWACARHIQRILHLKPEFGVIFYPLRQMLRKEAPSLLYTLEKLAVLEIRYKRLYSHGDEIDWTRPFNTSTKYFDLVTTTHPKSLAQRLTANDFATFCLLDPQSIIAHGPRFQCLNRRWNRLCMQAQEIIQFESSFRSHLTDLAKVSLRFCCTLNLLTTISGTLCPTELLPPMCYSLRPTRDRL